MRIELTSSDSQTEMAENQFGLLQIHISSVFPPGHSDLSALSDLSRVGARAGITTGATLSGSSLASQFLERKLDEG